MKVVDAEIEVNVIDDISEIILTDTPLFPKHV